MVSSRTNSARPSPTNPQRRYAFFTDRDLGRRVPDALESAGYRVELHADHFPHDAEDKDFLPEIGRHGDWIFLTHDARQRYVPDERDAIMRSGMAHVIHVGHLSHPELATSFVLAAPRLLRFRETHAPPFIAKLHRPERKTAYRTTAGAIRIVLTFEEWKREQGQ